MCTAVHFNNFFGRNFDFEFSYNPKIIITPQKFPLAFRKLDSIDNHFAIMGTGIVSDEYPLYFDGMNEAGLCMAGLNFPDNAHYAPICQGKENIAPFELIPYLLGTCKTVNDAKKLLTKVNLADIDFSPRYPNSPLHWMVADKCASIVIEPVKNALKIYDNPIGVLTNSPGFDYHFTNLSNYINVTAKEPDNRFSEKITLNPYSRGMGGIGLPGDFSSASRFIRSAFTLSNSSECNISQFFHILASAEQTKGSVHVNSKWEYTMYSCCFDMKNLTYCYTTYENHRITVTSLDSRSFQSSDLILIDMTHSEDILYI